MRPRIGPPALPVLRAARQEAQAQRRILPLRRPRRKTAEHSTMTVRRTCPVLFVPLFMSVAPTKPYHPLRLLYRYNYTETIVLYKLFSPEYSPRSSWLGKPPRAPVPAITLGTRPFDPMSHNNLGILHQTARRRVSRLCDLENAAATGMVGAGVAVKATATPAHAPPCRRPWDAPRNESGGGSQGGQPQFATLPEPCCGPIQCTWRTYASPSASISATYGALTLLGGVGTLG